MELFTRVLQLLRPLTLAQWHCGRGVKVFDSELFATVILGVPSFATIQFPSFVRRRVRYRITVCHCEMRGGIRSVVEQAKTGREER